MASSVSRKEIIMRTAEDIADLIAELPQDKNPYHPNRKHNEERICTLLCKGLRSPSSEGGEKEVRDMLDKLENLGANAAHIAYLRRNINVCEADRKLQDKDSEKYNQSAIVTKEDLEKFRQLPSEFDELLHAAIKRATNSIMAQKLRLRNTMRWIVPEDRKLLEAETQLIVGHLIKKRLPGIEELQKNIERYAELCEMPWIFEENMSGLRLKATVTLEDELAIPYTLSGRTSVLQNTHPNKSQRKDDNDSEDDDEDEGTDDNKSTKIDGIIPGSYCAGLRDYTGEQFRVRSEHRMARTYERERPLCVIKIKLQEIPGIYVARTRGDK